MFYDMEDIDQNGITDLRELTGTASRFDTHSSGMRIRATDDGENIYYQRIGDVKGDIRIAEVEYFMPTDYMLDYTGLTEEEFRKIYGDVAVGFEIQSEGEEEEEICLVNDFIRDDI